MIILIPCNTTSGQKVYDLIKIKIPWTVAKIVKKGKPAESSCEAEYIALSACINEVVWIIAFLTELATFQSSYSCACLL
jgi:hypothetical protein